MAADFAACPEMVGARSGKAGVCRRCAKPLVGRQRAWCSQACVDWWMYQHDWNWAKGAALKRDGHRCTRCERSPADLLNWALYVSWWMGWPPPGTFTNHNRASLALHARKGWHQTPAMGELRRAALDVRLEVNHIDPRRGQGYGAGCWNHQDNLETVCHRCHLGITAEQQREHAGRPSLFDAA